MGIYWINDWLSENKSYEEENDETYMNIVEISSEDYKIV